MSSLKTLKLSKYSIKILSSIVLPLPYNRFSLNVPSIIKGVTPTYAYLFENEQTLPFCGNNNPAERPSNVLLPEPFGPVTTVCEIF